MFRFSFPVTLRLDPGQTLAFHRGPRARMAVRAGVVHLTLRDDAQDHFLAVGDAMELWGAKEVVIEAARPGEPVLLSFEAPAVWRWGDALGRWAPRLRPACDTRTAIAG